MPVANRVVPVQADQCRGFITPRQCESHPPFVSPMSLLLIQQSAVLFWSTSIRARCCFQIPLDFSSLSPEPVSPSARAERSPQRRSAAGLHVRNGRAAPRAAPRVARLARLERRALRRDLLTDRREVLQVDREIGELRFRKRVAL